MALHREIKVNTDEVGLVTSRLGPAKLYLDDIQTIYDVLFKTVDKKLRIPGILKRPSVVITAGEAIADLPNDLQEATRDELREVKITLNEPLITVSLGSLRAYISYSSSDRQAQGLATGIMDFVNQKATLRSGGLRPFHNVTDVAAFLLILLLSGIIAYGSSVEAWLLGIAVFVVLTAVLIGFNLRTDYRYGAVRIIPRKQNEARGLSSETRKQLLIALVSAIIGAVIIGLAGLWAGFFHR